MTTAIRINRKSSRPTRRDRLIGEYEHDTCKTRGKLPEPTACRECGAVFRKGRWQWVKKPKCAHETLCPACHRIHDHYPGGYLTLRGPFQQEHRDEIVHLIENVEAREKAGHPLRRIILVNQQDDNVLITTTAMELARSIGDAVHRAYKGELCYQYTDEANILRVVWER